MEKLHNEIWATPLDNIEEKNTNSSGNLTTIHVNQTSNKRTKTKIK